MALSKVEIQEDDCIGCEQCVTECDAVFEMADDKAVVKAEAKAPEMVAAHSEGIMNAANACPSEAIKYE